MITLQNQIGHTFNNAQLLEQALTHKSFHNEKRNESVGHNERLEFLGDAVLGLSLTELLVKRFPDRPEGDLSKLRAGMVNEQVLADVGKKFELDQKIRLGKGELQSGGQTKPRLIASVFEALIGALFLDAGFERTRDFIEAVFMPLVESQSAGLPNEFDAKTRLQERAQELFRQSPSYSIISEEGPDHEKVFCVEVRVNGQVLAQGSGKSKKQAEQEAARVALRNL